MSERHLFAAANATAAPIHIYLLGKFLCDVRLDTLFWGWKTLEGLPPERHFCEQCLRAAVAWLYGAQAVQSAQEWAEAMLKERAELLSDQRAGELLARRPPQEVAWIANIVDANRATPRVEA